MNFLRSIRDTKNITQNQMASILGVAQGTVSKVERNKLTLDFEQLAILREKFQIDVNEYLDKSIQEEGSKDGE